MKKEDKEKDEVLALLGLVGNHPRFVARIFFICAIPSILNGIHLVNSTFLTETPQFWCDIPDLENATWTLEQKSNFSNLAGSEEPPCEIFDRDYATFSSMSYEEALLAVRGETAPRTRACPQHAFNSSTPSMAASFGLVCERDVMRSNVQFALSLGKFLGAFTGVMSDKFGRRKVLLYFMLLYIFAGPFIALSKTFLMVIFGRVLLGIASPAILNIPFTIMAECVHTDRRGLLAILFNMSYPIGMMIMSVLAYYVRDWRTLQCIISIPSFFLLFFWWLMPESPMWLLSKGRMSEAALFIETEYKKIQPGSEFHLKKTSEVTEIGSQTQVIGLEKESENVSQVTKFEEEIPSQNEDSLEKLKGLFRELILLVRDSELRPRLMLTMLLAGVLSFSYYGLALNVDKFDKYLFSFLTGLLEVVSYLLPLPLLKWLGRKQSAVLLFYITAFGLLVLLAVPNSGEFDTMIMVIVLTGRVCMTGAYAVFVLLVAELFPTVVRNTSGGVGSLGSHIGSMAAPFFVAIQSRIITNTAFGALAFAAGTAILLFPETKNKPLPNTVQDVSQLPKGMKVGCHQVCCGLI